MERAQTCPEPLPRAQHPLLADESSSVFREGFYSPSVAGGRTEKGLCWRAVRQVGEEEQQQQQTHVGADTSSSALSILSWVCHACWVQGGH